MKLTDEPKVIQDGDYWAAIIDGERSERFRSEADAWGFVRCLCDADEDDVGEVVDLDTEIAEHQRALEFMEMQLRNPPSDPDERARMQRTFALTRKGYLLRVTKAAEAEGAGKKH